MPRYFLPNMPGYVMSSYEENAQFAAQQLFELHHNSELNITGRTRKGTREK
jgi:hypothetical protein